MSRGKGKGEFSGSAYTYEEYNFIFFALIRGVCVDVVARIIGRKSHEVELCWKRLCYNATDYPYKKVYRVRPLVPRIGLPYFNGRTKEYITIQFTNPYILTSILALHLRTGIPAKSLETFITDRGLETILAHNIAEQKKDSQ